MIEGLIIITAAVWLRWSHVSRKRWAAGRKYARSVHCGHGIARVHGEALLYSGAFKEGMLSYYWETIDGKK